MRRLATTLGLLLAISWPDRATGDGPDLAEIRSNLANESIPLVDRVRIVLDGSAAIDQAAQQSGQAPERRARWSQAVSLLDEFLGKHPEVEAAPLIQFQGGVYRWAEGRSFADQAELTPADPKLRQGAIVALDDASRRLSGIAVKPGESTEPFAQNVRFRLAQAISDRVKLDPEGDPKRTTAERNALAMLDGSLTVPALRPFARLLRGELANRLGLFGQAQIEVEQAEKLTPPPPADALLIAKVTALRGRGMVPEALKAIESAKVGEPLKRWLELRLTLAERRDKPPGPERQEADAKAFRLAERSRSLGGTESRRALMDLARAIDEPAAEAPPDWWDLLAEGHLRLGDPTRAGRLVAKGADRAEAAGLIEKTGTLRYKSGAYLFEAGKFPEADRRLSQVLALAAAPRDLKARAGMLRALARGRAIATHDPDVSRSAYLSALEDQVRDYPDHPATGEARWLLGQVRLAAGRPDDASKLWLGIPRGHPRWLESRSIIADRQREAVDAQRLNRDTSAISEKMELARKTLKNALDTVTEGPEVVPLTLLLARLELTPEVGRLPVAIEACDRVLKTAAKPEQHQAARLLRMVALAQSNRGIEAEKAARVESSTEDLARLLPSLRLLDRAANESDSEVVRRRIGLIARIITSKLVDPIDRLPEALRDEARLQHARALLFSGDSAAARREIAAWGGPVGEMDDELLRELADTYQRLDAPVMAIDAERYRSGRLAPGSLPWLESRYGMALAYYRLGQLKEARKLIDATAILHQDLGGGDLKARFERLRQKMGQD